MKRKLKLLGLITVAVVVLGYVASSYAQVSYRRYLPFVRSSNEGDTGAMEIRLDDISMGELDGRLIDYGVTDPLMRQWVYNQELARRNAGGAGPSPEGYPSPEAQVDVVGFLPLFCFAGQGCHVIWTGMGTMRAHFQEARRGWMPWTNGIKCPGPKVCTVMASIGADNSEPPQGQKQYIGFGTSSLGVPIYNARQCFFAM